MYTGKQQEIYERVVQVICANIKRKDGPLSPGMVKPESDFMKDLGADSLMVVELVMGVEQEFDLDEIPESDIEKIRTVADVIDYLTKALQIS